MSPAFDAEALRVLKLMPKWNVSSMEGNGDWYVLPVYFKKQKKSTLKVNIDHDKEIVVSPISKFVCCW